MSCAWRQLAGGSGLAVLRTRPHQHWRSVLGSARPSAPPAAGILAGTGFAPRLGLPQQRPEAHLDVLVGRGPALALLRFSGLPLQFDLTEASFSLLQR